MKVVNYKVPGGKMIKVKLSINNQEIESISILGDFFLHPEEMIEKIEEHLIGCIIDYESLVSRLEEIIIENKAMLIGISTADIAKAIQLASESD
ncbi:MAG: hypothetical protein JW779_15355 [Candidatus Thorarchaeota archaeon]|nr:hypothetical protein [Candidatus Thorarchaeota archaeon]